MGNVNTSSSQSKSRSKMMEQYDNVKEQYSDCVVFYRVGDFYEMFDDDAIEMSKALDLTLTGKGKDEKRSAMCGVPVKALDIYIQKALEKGYKIAICEQLTEPVKGQQLVERDVVRVITPGTVMESSILDEKKNNYIACFYSSKNGSSICWCDITTGELNVCEIEKDANESKICDILTAIEPAEIICNSVAFEMNGKIEVLSKNSIAKFNLFNDNAFVLRRCIDVLNGQFKTLSLKPFDLEDKPNSICSAGALMQYLSETQKRSLTHIDGLKIVNYSRYMHFDYQSMKNLELVKNARDGGKYGTLLWYLDKASTSMGSRLLKKFVSEPLQNVEEIRLRQDAVEELFKNLIKRDSINKTLSKINDIERLCGRVSYNSLVPNDCVALRFSLQNLPELKELLKDSKSKVLKSIYENIGTEEELVSLIESAIVDQDTPSNTKDGGYIKEGYSKELDELRYISANGKSIIDKLEETEKELTQIKGLKIRYNRIFGYYIEVPNGQKSLVPFRYNRKQTLSNCERYVTEELAEIEEKIIGSQEKAIRLEKQLFDDLRNKLLERVNSIKNTGLYVAYLDALCSLANVAVKNNLTKPKIVEKDSQLVIAGGRHPIVESIGKEIFVPNDTLLDKDENRTMVITGPNMAGKSTYMRQVAIITIMAHIGSFVPAQSAQIPIVDRVFTRIGATDDLAYGQSTFMVEMSEVANILRNATDNSLIILDEIGRGTSTFDGLSIAWSVMEYISKNLRAKTLFSTHYHELTELEGNLQGVKNYNVSIREHSGSIVFLRKVVRGGANRSFGIEVASLAGLPNQVIEKAKEILHSLEEADINKKVEIQAEKGSEQPLTLKRNEKEVLSILNGTVVEKITPFEAISLIYDLKEKLKK